MASDISCMDRPIGIFLNQQNAFNYQCTICRSVFLNATSIGCDEDHMFCKSCLDQYFSDIPVCVNQQKRCPSCRQRGLNKSSTRACKYIDRIINSEKVKCLLQFRESLNDSSAPLKCRWSGELINLLQHMNVDCPLYVMVCEDCQHEIRRCQIVQHNYICPQKKILCPQRCETMVERSEMANHKRIKCPMTIKTCDECKTNVLRKDLDHHRNHICREHEVICPFCKYGCRDKIKRKSLSEHLKKREIRHLKLKVEYLEEMVVDMSANTNNDQQIVMITKSNQMHIAHLNSKYIRSLQLNSTIRGYRLCVAKDVSFSNTVKMGFDPSVLSMNKNNIIFDMYSTGINAIHVKSRTTVVDIKDIARICYTPIYHHKYGILLIGGEDKHKHKLRNIETVTVNANGCGLQHELMLPNEQLYPSVCLHESGNLLFVCGGILCDMYRFVENKWIKMANTNHGHVAAPAYLWTENGNKIIIGGGYTSAENDTNHFVEQYDPKKDIWKDLPKLNYRHESNSTLFGYDGVLFCIGGVIEDTLGYIEMYDARDNANKWMVVSSVEKYFNINKSLKSTKHEYNHFFAL